MDLNPLHVQIATENGYALLRELGKGGMGVVYLAREQSTGQERAFKLIRDDALNETTVALFDREIANVRSLEHPNIVRTFQSGTTAGRPFLVMEYCDGGSVDQLVKKGPIAADRALEIIRDVLDGLEYAHSAPLSDVALADGQFGSAIGLVHRDLKPHNMFLGQAASRQSAKVADFGLAKAFALAGLSGMTRTGESAGTTAFMPRQQAIDFKYAKPEVDTWAAAASLYFMLTGFVPRNFYAGADPFETIWNSDPVPILDRGVPMPAWLARVVDEALVDRPEIRVKTVAELRALLARAAKNGRAPAKGTGRNEADEGP